MEFFAVLTMGIGRELVTMTDVITVTNGGMTPAHVFDSVKDMFIDQAGPRWEQAAVVFFSAEPNVPGASR